MNKICPAYGIQMGTILGQIFCTFHKDGCILGRNFLYILVKWVHFSGKNVCTLGRKFVPEPSITSKIRREPPPGKYAVHDLEVTDLNPGQVKILVHSTSV